MHLYDILKEASAAEPFDCELKKDEPMERYTSFRIGGPCDVMATPKSEEDLVRLIRFLRRERIRTTVIGNATNLLVSDAGIRGVVVRVFGVADVCTREEGTCLRLGAGALLSKAAVFAMRQSLTGFEFAHGIPGAVGGAVMMNAGAYGGEMKDVVESVAFLDQSGAPAVLGTEELGFGYRKSYFTDHPGCVILHAEVRLAPADAREIRRQMDDLAQRRREKQPLEYPSAGSIFKRPVGCFAGKLIEDAGMKGAAVGGAQVSEKHAGFIINRGGATCADVLELIELVKARVFETSGVSLECEIRVTE